MNHMLKTHVLLFSQIGDLFDSPIWQPPVDIYRTRRGWLLKYELAGVNIEDLRLSINDSTLRLTGTRRDLCCGEDCIHHTMEIAYSRFERSVEMPHSLAGATVRPELVNGMLMVSIELPNHER